MNATPIYSAPRAVDTIVAERSGNRLSMRCYDER